MGSGLGSQPGSSPDPARIHQDRTQIQPGSTGINPGLQPGLNPDPAHRAGIQPARPWAVLQQLRDPRDLPGSTGITAQIQPRSHQIPAWIPAPSPPWDSPRALAQHFLKLPRLHLGTRSLLDPPDPSRTFQISHGSFRSHLDPPHLSWILQISHRCSRFHQDPPDPSWILQIPPGPSRFHTDSSDPPWLHQISPGSSRLLLAPPDPFGIHQIPSGSTSPSWIPQIPCQIPDPSPAAPGPGLDSQGPRGASGAWPPPDPPWIPPDPPGSQELGVPGPSRDLWGVLVAPRGSFLDLGVPEPPVDPSWIPPQILLDPGIWGSRDPPGISGGFWWLPVGQELRWRRVRARVPGDTWGH
ncbi:formin-like protein 5 [Camarhynchus parvulus]|uniref:formin-like protein 5 n=1 Tax=Geospiza parvula TaxID=87175 RepID=UPI0012381E92|nr:formin-like protein 5 [Camarhynchus parvulus]